MAFRPSSSSISHNDEEEFRRLARGVPPAPSPPLSRSSSPSPSQFNSSSPSPFSSIESSPRTPAQGIPCLFCPRIPASARCDCKLVGQPPTQVVEFGPQSTWPREWYERYYHHLDLDLSHRQGSNYYALSSSPPPSPVFDFSDDSTASQRKFKSHSTNSSSVVPRRTTQPYPLLPTSPPMPKKKQKTEPLSRPRSRPSLPAVVPAPTSTVTVPNAPLLRAVTPKWVYELEEPMAGMFEEL